MSRDACTRCERPMHRTHHKERVPAGERLHAAHGLCEGCYKGERRFSYVRGTGTNHGSRTDPPDEIAVHRALRGERLRLTATERRAAVLACRDQRLSIAETARLLGLSSRTVGRWRSKGTAA